jgi:predicted nucleotidyltransferase
MIARERINDVTERIARQFAPDRIVLFGSYAYGTPDEGSDVDLLVVLPFEGKPYRKGFPLDILARHPDDVERRYRESDPLVRDALDRGRVLYDRNR